jgi:AraC-like DNA-binding protein
MCGRYYSEGIEPNAFAGWVRPVTARGFTALDIGCNAHQVERTYRDVRLLGTGQLLSEIAYASGFRDYTHFARKFRHRFGYPPGVTRGPRLAGKSRIGIWIKSEHRA